MKTSNIKLLITLFIIFGLSMVLLSCQKEDSSVIATEKVSSTEKEIEIPTKENNEEVSNMEESSEEENSEESTENSAPVIEDGLFSVLEHSNVGTLIGYIQASDIDEDTLTFNINSDSGLQIDENTGEIRVNDKNKFDFEVSSSQNFTVSVTDGKVTIEKDFLVEIANADEFELLTNTEKDLVDYFKYLAFNKNSSGGVITNLNKWHKVIKIYFEGVSTISHRETLTSVVMEFNEILGAADLSIQIVDNQADSNIHYFYGSKSLLQIKWPDVYAGITDCSLGGRATTSISNNEVIDSRIWVRRTSRSVFAHELSHSLGLGHSNKCSESDTKSYLCTNIPSISIGGVITHDILESDKKVIKYLYSNEVLKGMTETEVNRVVASLILKE